MKLRKRLGVSNKMVAPAAVIIFGILITSLSIFIVQKSWTPKCSEAGFRLNRVERGFPIPYLVLEPSVSLCTSVESISILREGNAYHEQRYVAAGFDVIFWSGALALAMLVAKDPKGHKR